MPTPAESPSPVPFRPTRRQRAMLAHRRVRRWIAALSFTLLPGVWGAWALLPSPAGPVAALCAWLTLWVALVARLAVFRCPACERRAHLGPILDLFGTRCVHCGASLDPGEKGGGR